MTYVPTTWQNNRSPALNEANLNKLEQAVKTNSVDITGKAATTHSHLESDISNLDKYTQASVDAKDAAALVSANAYTYSQVGIDGKDAATLSAAEAYTYSQAVIDSKDLATYNAGGANLANYTYHKADIDGKDTDTFNASNASMVGYTYSQASIDSKDAATLSSANSYTDSVGSEIPSGSKMVFYQSTTPTGWTFVPVGDWRMLIAGASAGGFVGGVDQPYVHNHTTGDFELQVEHNGPHTHQGSEYILNYPVGNSGGAGEGSGPGQPRQATTSGSSGSGSPHNHGVTSTYSPMHVAVMICQKQ